MKMTTLSFSSLISSYKKLQSGIMTQVRSLASKMCQANPGQFILLQFQMAQVTQVGESISNLIANVNTVIMNAVRNQKQQ
jgi:hypothetical protein